MSHLPTTRLFARRWAGALLAVACAALSQGCDGSSPVAPGLPEGNVPWVSLFAEQSSGITDFRRAVIRTEAPYESFWDELETANERPTVDFNADMVVAVASGEQPNSCYEIAVTAAVSDGTDLTVTVTETVESPDCLCAPEIQHPVEVVRFPRADQVTFDNLTVEATCDS